MSKPDITALPSSFFDLGDSDNTCFLCNKPNYELEYEVTHFEFPFKFQKCQCGLVKQTPMPNENFFEWFFNSDPFFDVKKTDNEEIWGYHNYFADESSRLATSRIRYKKLKKYFEASDKKSNILKIGPATGTMLHVLQQEGHSVRGADVSNRFAQYAMDNYNVPIDIGRFEKMDYEDDQFDVILLFNVIENVPNLDEFLQVIYKKLKPGGYFIHNYVDMENNWVSKLQKSKYFLYRPPICYIATRTVHHKLMDKYKFEIIDEIWDYRYMHLEKISTLLRWKYLHSFAKMLNVHRINFRLYAYPSKIVVAQK